MNKCLILTIIGLLVVVYTEYRQVKFANDRWERAGANVKAYAAQFSEGEGKATALQLTVDQLSCLRDSVLQELDATRKQLKVKNKSLKALQQLSSSFSKADTVTLTDTLFRGSALAVDTLIGDEWYNVRLGLHYPSTVTVRPYFKSEKHIVVSSKKETVNPPKRFFLLRWLQKKHRVLHVDVIERNPYVDGESSKYVEIIQ